MNPLTNVKNITKLNEIELARGTTDKKSWHNIYKESAWIFIGGLAYGLTEGDVLAVFSQYGEIVNINLVRDKKTGKTKGFCFLCYANQKSTVLAVDNFNGIKLLNRTIRVDHVANYKPPKDNELDDDITKQLKSEGCAPKPIKQEASPIHVASSSKKKKSKKEKKKRKKDKKEAGDKSDKKKCKIKKEKHDPGYDKYEIPQNSEKQSKKAKNSRSSDSESSTSGKSSDESFVNSNKSAKEKSHDKKIFDKTHNIAAANDFTKYNKGSDNFRSNRKRNFSDSESDLDNNYELQKKSKASNDNEEKRISFDHHSSKHKSKRRRNSDSSELSPNDDERKNVGKALSHEQPNTSRSSSFKNTYISGNQRADTEQQRHRSSSIEDVDQSNSHRNQSRKKDSIIRFKSESKEYDRNVLQNIDDRSGFKNSNDRSDPGNNLNRSARGYNSDRKNIEEYGDRNNTYDRRNTDVRGDHKNRDDQDGHRNNYAKSSRINYEEQSHHRKHSDRNDHKSYDYEKDGENSTKDSSKYSRSVQNIRSPSIEREEKHYSKHRHRDDNRKDWYDRRK